MKIEIFQMRDDPDTARRAFQPSDKVLNAAGRLPRSLYQKVYEFESPTPLACEDVYVMFNINRPTEYSGRSVSVSDVVALEGVPFYCEPVGWTIMEWGEDDV